MNLKNIIFLQITLIYIFTFSGFSQRYICKLNNSNQDNLNINLFTTADEVNISGVVGKGVYKIIQENSSGLLAINASRVGKEFGIQTLFLNKENKKFFLKSKISNTNNIIKNFGVCKPSI